MIRSPPARSRQAIRDGLTVQEITALLSVDRRVVIYWEKKLKGEKTDA